jgi:hypothetical protein
MEEICNLDFSGHDDSEVGWLSKIMKKTVDKQWLIEKEIFLNTPSSSELETSINWKGERRFSWSPQSSF